MTRTQIIAHVLFLLGRQESNTYLIEQAKTCLGLIQEKLEGGALMPWFLLTDELSLATVANLRSVAVPSDFLREWEDYPLTYYDVTAEDPYIELDKDEFNYLREQFGSSETGPPQAYSLDGQVYSMFPTPADIYTLTTRYFAKDEVLTDSVLENNWTEHATDVLIAELGMMLSAGRRDPAINQYFATEAGRAHRRLLAFDEARKQALRDARRGDRA